MNDPQLEVMAEIAQPLDEWCEFGCGRLATVTSADGMKACHDCAKQVIEAMQHYEREARQAETVRVRSNGSHVKPGAAKAKAKRRAKRKRTKR